MININNNDNNHLILINLCGRLLEKKKFIFDNRCPGIHV